MKRPPRPSEPRELGVLCHAVRNSRLEQPGSGRYLPSEPDLSEPVRHRRRVVRRGMRLGYVYVLLGCVLVRRGWGFVLLKSRSHRQGCQKRSNLKEALDSSEGIRNEVNATTSALLLHQEEQEQGTTAAPPSKATKVREFVVASSVAACLLWAVVQTGDPRVWAGAFLALNLSSRWRGRG